MSTIVTRSGKQSPLTNTELDANFTNLNSDKLESGDLSVVTTAVGTAALAYNSGVFTYTPPDLSAIDLSLYAPLAGAVFTGNVEAPLFEGDLTGAILFKGSAGEALTKGDPVYISGISGNKTVVSKADANDANKMPCFGIVDDTVSLNADCSVVTFGTLQGLDTSSFSEGDELYISDTGTLTTTAPTGEASQIQKIAKVTRSHASAGSIKVMGAGRTNATPNLNDGNFFLGNASNQAVSADFTTAVRGEISAGTGIGLSGGVISNTAPDQTVALTGGTGISTSGTYPSFTITNDSPDQTVALTGAGATSISGTYPNFTITSTDTTYSLPLSSSSTRGGVKVGYSENGKNYPVELSSEKMYVNVPWTDSDTTYSAGTGITLTGTTFSLTDTNAKLNLSGGTLTGNLTISIPDGGSSPATTAVLDIRGYEGRGAGIKIRDSANSASNANNREWFIGSGYSQSGFSIGYSATGSQSSYTAQNKLSIDTSGNVTAAGTITATGYNDSNWNTAYGWGNHASAGYYPASNPNGYTNDQTAAEILTAIKTVDGSGSGLDADTVDGLHGSDIVETSDTISGNLNTEYDAQMFSWSTTTTGKPASDYGQGISIVSSGKTHNETNNWITQLGFGTTNTTSYFRTKVNTGSWSDWRTIWNSANDGSGSGLDADLLDGQQGSYYYPASNPNGYTNDQTAAEILTAIKTVDGSGSGLDADTVDGVHESTFMRKTANSALNMANNNITNVNHLTFNDPGANEGLQWLGGNDWRIFESPDNLTNASGNLQFTTGGTRRMTLSTGGSAWTSSQGTLWGASNDGSGSGLDADLLDGQQGSYYYSAGNPPPLTADPTLTLTGDVTGSATFTNLGNATLTATVLNDSHSHSNYTPLDHIRSLGVPAFTSGGGSNSNITTAALIAEIESDGGFDSYSSVFKTSWSYASNDNLTDAGRFTETAGTSWLTWTDNSSDTTRGNITALAIAPNAGGSAGKMFVYNDQGGGYSPGWREIWTSTSDGSGSGLDADLLDGQHGSYYAPASHVHSYLPLTGGTLTGALKLEGGSYSSGTDTATVALAVDKGDYIYSDDGTYLRRIIGHTTSGAIEIGQGGTGLVNSINLLPGTYGNSAARVNGNTIWNAGNDGSGSGLDADTCDGQHLGSTALVRFGGVEYYNGTSSNINVRISGSGDSSAKMYWKKAGTTNLLTLDMSGNLTATGNVTAYSDRRIKENITPITEALSKVQRLTGNTYTRNDQEDTATKYAGLIAQEVEDVLPEAVREADDGIKVLDYNATIALLVESIKELKAEVDDLKSQLENK